MLATLDDLKKYLGIEAGNTGADAELTRMLGMATTVANEYTERALETATHTEVRSGNGSDTLLVRDGPIASVTSLAVAGTAIAASDGTTDGYVFEAHRVFLIGSVFCRGRRNIAITYVGGYAANAVPADIQHAVIEIAAQAYREKDWIGVQSRTLASESVSFARGFLPDSAKQVLDRYRRTYPVD